MRLIYVRNMEQIELLLIFLISNFRHVLNVVPLLRHAPSDWLSNFEPNPYLYKYPSNFDPVIPPAYTTYEDGTVFRNVGT
jgi:hypothetical protein